MSTGDLTYPETATTRMRAERPSDDAHDRSPFAKDRDRLLYSDAFRNLSGKSQVVPVSSLGPYHNRMTHSIRVAQLGRRLAEALRSPDAPNGAIAAPDPDLVELACLAHDIGHPPYGHVGERALLSAVDAAMGTPAEFLAAGGFEGNPQTLRLLSRLEQKHHGSDLSNGSWTGLNLTAASLDAVTKYPWKRESLRMRKWGAYPGDADVLDKARSLTGGTPIEPHAMPCFEAQLMEWCDDVSYAVHDFDDFCRAGMIPVNLLFPAVRTEETEKEWADFREFVSQQWESKPSLPSDYEAIDQIRDSLMSEVDCLATDRVYDDTAMDRRRSTQRSSRLVRHFVNEISAGDGLPMLHHGSLHIRSDPQDNARLRAQCSLLKEITRKYVIRAPIVQETRAEQDRTVLELFDMLMASPSGVPSLYLEVASSDPGLKDDLQVQVRATSDYIASLTEPLAQKRHADLLNSLSAHVSVPQ